MGNRKGKDWTNQKFNKLTFIKATDKKHRKAIRWEALCDCGNTTIVTPCDVTSGNTTSCGCYRLQRLKETCVETGKKARKYIPLISSARSVWSNYKGCSFEYFFKLSQQNCHYCNRPPHRTFNVAGNPNSQYKTEDQINNGNFTYNGLDRVNSQLGHVEGNLVTCCYDCNKAKSALSQTEFFNLIKMIYQNRIELHND